jgi:hypothetical protein
MIIGLLRPSDTDWWGMNGSVTVEGRFPGLAIVRCGSGTDIGMIWTGAATVGGFA